MFAVKKTGGNGRERDLVECVAELPDFLTAVSVMLFVCCL